MNNSVHLFFLEKGVDIWFNFVVESEQSSTERKKNCCEKFAARIYRFRGIFGSKSWFIFFGRTSVFGLLKWTFLNYDVFLSTFPMYPIRLPLRTVMSVFKFIAWTRAFDVPRFLYFLVTLKISKSQFSSMTIISVKNLESDQQGWLKDLEAQSTPLKK